MSIEQKTLLELIQRSRQGDRQAQEELVEAVQNRVYYHCRKMLKKEEDALDATQDVLLVMITSLDKLKESAAFWGWVNGITANRCRHLLTAPHQEWQIPENEEGESLLDSLENLDESLVPEKALDDGETRRMMMELVDALPAEQRMCVLFYYYDEMSVKDIAQAMGTSEGTVKSRLNYARKAIKGGVEEYERKGVKLYSVSPILLLVLFLRREAAHTVLEGASAAAMAAQVLSRTGESAAQSAASAASGGASGSAAGTTAGTTAGTAAGTSAGSATAAAATGAAKAVSVKVIAGALAGVIALGGAGVGLTSVLGRETQEQPPAASSSQEKPREEEELPPEELPFGEEYAFPITQPQAYQGLPLTLLLDDPRLVPLPSESTITCPVISVSGPDQEGYVTYTITYDITAQTHLGAEEAAPFSGSILAQEYNLYDYHTGRLYLTDLMESGGAVTKTGGSASLAQGELTYERTWESSMEVGPWTRSDREDAAWEMTVHSAMSITWTIRAPANYDGLLLGVNVTDPADPEKEIREEWDLETDDPSHYRFVRLLPTGGEG